jgi:chromosome segregation ATPase
MIIVVGILVLTAVALVVVEFSSLAKPEKRGVLSQLPEFQIDNLAQQIRSLKEEIDKLRINQVVTHKELKSLEDEKVALENKQQVLEQEYNRLRNENLQLKYKGDRYDLLEKEKEKILAQVDGLNRQITDLKQEIDSRNCIITELRLKKEQVENRLASIESEYVLVKDELEKSRIKEAELNRQLAIQRRWINIQEEELEKLKEENAELHDDFEYEKHYG